MVTQFKWDKIGISIPVVDKEMEKYQILANLPHELKALGSIYKGIN